MSIVDRMKGIKYRQDEAVGGFFSQIGEMHQVHHLWGMLVEGRRGRRILELCPCPVAYKDLEDRVETRQAAWEFPGWDECVVKTG